MCTQFSPKLQRDPEISDHCGGLNRGFRGLLFKRNSKQLPLWTSTSLSSPLPRETWRCSPSSVSSTERHPRCFQGHWAAEIRCTSRNRRACKKDSSRGRRMPLSRQRCRDDRICRQPWRIPQRSPGECRCKTPGAASSSSCRPRMSGCPQEPAWRASKEFLGINAGSHDR